MNTIEIRHALRTCRFTSTLFENVVAANELPRTSEHHRGAYVVNTHENYLPGEHWVVVHYTKDRLIYFDSYGLPPPDNIYRALLNTGALVGRELSYFNQRVQGIRNTCGLHCIYFILTLASPSHTMNIFNHDLDFNDRLVVKLVSSIFDLRRK